MGEPISLTAWIQGGLTGPVPIMAPETAAQVLGFLDEVGQVKRAGKNFAVHAAHLRDLGEDEEAALYEAIYAIPLERVERVAAELRKGKGLEQGA